MTTSEIKKLAPMKYWALSSTASASQKNKLLRAFQEGYILTLKRDGLLYRGIVGEDGEVTLQSRTVSAKTKEFVEKQDRVPLIVSSLKRLPKGTVVMGEICFPIGYEGSTSSDVVSIMGCNAEKAIDRQKSTPLVFYLFDILMYNGEDYSKKPYKKRLEKLLSLNQVYQKDPSIEIVEPVYTEIEQTITNYLENGYEGGMLMKADEPYFFGKRPSWVSVKIKQSVEDIDLVIMGYSPATKDYTGKYPASHQYWENVRTGELVEGTFYGKAGYSAVSSTYFNRQPGGFILGAYYGEELIEVARVSNLTDDLLSRIEKDKSSFVGKVVEISAMMIDVNRKSVRHPKLVRVREDKNAEECQYLEIFK